MQFTINGKPVRDESLSYREINFGREAAGASLVPDQLLVPVEEFSQALGSFYKDFAEDDRIYYDDVRDRVIVNLRSLGWPPLDELTRGSTPIFCRLMTQFLAYDALQALLGNRNPVAKKQYVINTIKAVSVVEDRVSFEGSAFDAENAGPSSGKM